MFRGRLWQRRRWFDPGRDPRCAQKASSVERRGPHGERSVHGNFPISLRPLAGPISAFLLFGRSGGGRALKVSAEQSHHLPARVENGRGSLIGPRSSPRGAVRTNLPAARLRDCDQAETSWMAFGLTRASLQINTFSAPTRSCSRAARGRSVLTKSQRFAGPSARRRPAVREWNDPYRNGRDNRTEPYGQASNAPDVSQPAWAGRQARN
jgi:hypothetical protein